MATSEEILPADPISRRGDVHIAHLTETEPCEHYYVRVSPREFLCRDCRAGWFDNNNFHFKDGKFTHHT